MMRRVLIALGLLGLVGCAIALGHGLRPHQLWPEAAWLGLVTLGLIFERRIYKPELDAPPGPGWVQTLEKSTDAKGTVSVWFNPANGERAYVRDRR